jgi:hypothetical protein
MKSHRYRLIKLGVVAALLVWMGVFAIGLLYWGILPLWAKVAVLVYSLAIVSDRRVFRVPFMSEEDIDREFD